MDIIPQLFFFIVMIPSAIFHEYMHGWVADQLGDPTARYAGRLTLNPIVHIDLLGTLVLPLLLFLGSGGRFLFAYAKPVPYNPYNLKNQQWGPALVAIAGPSANFILAILFGLVLRFAPISAITHEFVKVIVYANVLLGVFNLVPIPPLDGSKILYAILPSSLDWLKSTLDRYGIILLLFFMIFLFQWLYPVIAAVFTAIAGEPLA